MLIAPFIIQYSERIVVRLFGQRMADALDAADQDRRHSRWVPKKHAIPLRLRRNGQYLARFRPRRTSTTLPSTSTPTGARSSTGGENVVYGDAGRKEALMAAGLMRASGHRRSAIRPWPRRCCTTSRKMRHDLPVVVRTADERDMECLTRAGAAEVVPGGAGGQPDARLHALVLVGVPINRAEAHPPDPFETLQPAARLLSRHLGPRPTTRTMNTIRACIRCCSKPAPAPSAKPWTNWIWKTWAAKSVPSAAASVLQNPPRKEPA